MNYFVFYYFFITYCQKKHTYNFIKQTFENKGFNNKNIPVIDYFYENNKIHKYYPDIYIPLDNLIIEVKSTWTYKKDKNKNTIKKLTYKNNGYDFQFWIFDKKYNLEII